MKKHKYCGTKIDLGIDQSIIITANFKDIAFSN